MAKSKKIEKRKSLKVHDMESAKDPKGGLISNTKIKDNQTKQNIASNFKG